MSEPVYNVQLTEAEMQCLANACAAFYNVTLREGTKITPTQTAVILNAMEKFKRAVDGKAADIVVVHS